MQGEGTCREWAFPDGPEGLLLGVCLEPLIGKVNVYPMKPAPPSGHLWQLFSPLENHPGNHQDIRK